MSFRDLKILTFDVVGTLIDFEKGILQSVRRIGGPAAAELTEEEIFHAYKHGRDAHHERSSAVMGLVMTRSGFLPRVPERDYKDAKARENRSGR
jgi:putative hydrolase of the HAD superfamily